MIDTQVNEVSFFYGSFYIETGYFAEVVQVNRWKIDDLKIREDEILHIAGVHWA